MSLNIYTNYDKKIDDTSTTVVGHTAQLTDMVHQPALDITNANVLANTSAIALKASTINVNTQIAAVASGSPKGVYTYLSDLQTAYPTGNTNIYLVLGNIKEVDTLSITGAPTAAGNVTVTLNGVATNIAVTSGVAEVASLNITAIPTVAGNVTVTLNGVATNIAVDPATDTTTDLVATKIRNTTFSGWTTSGTASNVTFTAISVGVKTDAVFTIASTGVNGTMSTSIQGVDADTTTTVAAKIRGTVFTGWTTSGTGTTIIFTSTTAITCSTPLFSAASTGSVGAMSVTIKGATVDGNWYYWNGSAWTLGGIYQSTGLANGSVTLPILEPNLQSKIVNTPQLAASTHYMKVGLNDAATIIDNSNTIEFTTNTTYGDLGFTVPNTLGNKYIAVTTITNIGIVDASNVQRIKTYNNIPSGIGGISKNGAVVGSLVSSLIAGGVLSYIDQFTSDESAYTGIALSIITATNGVTLKVTQNVYNISTLTDDIINNTDWTNPPAYTVVSEFAKKSLSVKDGTITLSNLETNLNNKIYNAIQLAASSKYMSNGINTASIVIDDINTIEFTTNTTYGLLGLTAPNTLSNKYVSVLTITNIGSIDALNIQRSIVYNNNPNGISSVAKNGAIVGILVSDLPVGQILTFTDEFTSTESAYTAIALGIMTATNGAILKIKQTIYNVTSLSDSVISAITWTNLPPYIIISEIANQAVNAVTANTALAVQIKWKGKRWYAHGDSITAQNHYEPTVQTINGIASYFNGGTSGASFVAFMQYNYINLTEVANADIMTVFAGTNDYGGSVALGTINDAMGTATTYGAIKWLIDQILITKPAIRLAFITPLQRGVFTGQPTYPAPNSLGFHLEDYVKAIKDVCGLYAIPVLDLFNISGINSYNLSIYLADGLHPNVDVGAPLIGKIIASWMETL